MAEVTSQNGCKPVLAESSHSDSKCDEPLFILFFVARYFVVLTACLLLMISILYAIGSLISLQADNFFCPSVSEEEVRLYNFENGHSHGLWGSCYYIDRKVVHWSYIYNLNINIFSATFVDSTSVAAIFQCSMFVFVSICMFTIAVYHSYFILYDTIFVIIGKPNPRIAKALKSIIQKFIKQKKNALDKHEIKVSDTQKQKYIKMFFKSIVSKFQQLKNDYYKRYYYPDSMVALSVMWFKELIEILIQCYALLLYGGLNVFMPTQNILAQEPYVVRG